MKNNIVHYPDINTNLMFIYGMNLYIVNSFWHENALFEQIWTKYNIGQTQYKWMALNRLQSIESYVYHGHF